MKKAISIMLLVLQSFLITPTMMYSGNNTSASQTNPITVTIGKKKTPSLYRPRIPSHSVIELSYYPEQNLCIFNLGDTDIQYMTVEIENLESGETYCDMVDASCPCINISLTPSTYSITCTTDDDSIYTGEFDIQ